MKNVQNPVTVVKGDHVVKDVYLSDLPAWEAEGYQVLGQEKAIATEQPKKQVKKSTPVEPE
jgi:hypothetical protein